jgi:hypothetical protein
MSNAALLIVLAAAAVLIVAVCLTSLSRKQRSKSDYWLPDGTKLKRKADGIPR